MPSELDRQYDAVLAEVTGPGGRDPARPRRAGPRDRHQSAGDPAGPVRRLLRSLHGATEAVVAGEERLTFAELDDAGDAGSPASLAGSWDVAKGDRVAIAMRNCPAWIVAYMAAIKAGGDRHPDQRLVAGGRDAPRPRPDRAEADHRRRAAGRAARRERLHDPDRVALPVETAARRGAGAPARARRRGRPARDRARGRRDHPVHLGLDRPRQGRGLDPPRGHHRQSMPMRSASPTLLGIMESEGRAAGEPAQDPGQRAALPRHRRGAGAAQQLRDRPDDGADAEMGCRARRCG